MAKASGSIPIEYISIRRDPKPSEKHVEKVKKSITTGTNTNVERGKRIAATNTDTEPEIPRYNLHLSLDSLIKKENKREVSTSTDRVRCLRHTGTVTEKNLSKDACTLTDNDADTDSEVGKVTSHMEIPVQEHHRYSYRSRKERFQWETASSPGVDIEESYRLELLAKSPRTMRRKQHVQQHHQTTHTQSYRAIEDDTDISDHEHVYRQVPVNVQRHEEIRIDDDDKLIFGESYSQQRIHERRDYSSVNKRSGSYPTQIRVPLVQNDGLVTTRRYVKTTNTNFWPPFPQPINCQIGIMPITNGAVSTEAWNSQFNEMHSKFNQMFGTQQINTAYAVQPIVTDNGKTERLY